MPKTQIKIQPKTQNVILNYFSYLALFVGTGFISGAIVHSGNIKEISKYIIIGVVGIILFVVGSFIQESLISNKDSDKDSNQKIGTLKFFFYSLLLSIGIGAISGGTQHFSDFPVYASFLIPMGFIISWFAFVLKNNFKFTKNLLIVGSLILILALPVYLGLNSYANSYNKTLKFNASPKQTEHNADAVNIKNDKTFIEYVIPHHQDAVDSSNELLKTTVDPELKIFLNNVITTQTQEIETLKKYYKQWFNSEYKDTNSYQKMMKSTKVGIEADKEYITGMLSHHSGIITIAKNVLTDSKFQYKSEILDFSKKIIKDQESDNLILKKWLSEKYIKDTSDARNSVSSLNSTEILPLDEGMSDHNH